jgi:hypothetical protein
MLKYTDVPDVVNNSIALMMEAVRTSKWSVNFNVITRRYISDSKLYTRRRENLKSHFKILITDVGINLRTLQSSINTTESNLFLYCERTGSSWQ